MVDDTPSAAELEVGSRLYVGGNLATIRWGPEVLPGQGEDRWFGVEYDEVGKGKHDGTHNGIRRFTCPEKTGSFVKVQKVSPPLSFGEALQSKYSDEEVPLEFHDHAKARSRSVEFVGRAEVVARMQNFQSLCEINLSSCLIGDSRNCLQRSCTSSAAIGSASSDPARGGFAFPNLQRLSLDHNLITSWSTLADIWTGCPQLAFLSVTGNRLARPTIAKASTPGPTANPSSNPDTSDGSGIAAFDESRTPLPPCPSLRALVLNETGVGWDAMPTHLFSELEELHVRANGWERLAEDLPERLPCLAHVQLEDNCLQSWDQTLEVLQRLPRLRSVNVSGNQLTDETLRLGAALPPTVTSVSCSNNLIRDWKTIAWLISHTGLRQLVVSDNPIGHAQALRQIVLALMPSLNRLNASEITSRERVNAERMFLSLWANGSISEILEAVDPAQLHRKRLEAVHGEGFVYQKTAENTGGSAFGANLMELTLQPAGGSILHLPPLRKKIPGTISIAELKTFCHNCFQRLLPVKEMRLAVVNPGDPIALPFAEDDDAREVCFYVQTGATIQVLDQEDGSASTG
ncbi:unnamed protein product [Amoebophrya sp. A120]|nr:unnamed protein product [Amoebophrya sp. A120]|eukprot:GSA120T00021661001.1